MERKWHRIPVWLCAAALMVFVLSGCVRDLGDGASVSVIELESWAPEALVDDEGSLLVIERTDAGVSRMVVLGVDDTRRAEIWNAPEGYDAVLLDVDPVGPRALVRLTEQAGSTPSALEDILALLEADGTVRVLPGRPDAYPQIGDASFVADGAVLIVEALQTREAIETTLSVCDPASGSTTVLVTEGMPEHHFVWSVMSEASGSDVILVLKTQGTPASDDDFAVVLADVRGSTLEVERNVYRDDALFTAQPTTGDGFVYVRNGVSDTEELETSLVSVIRTGGTWEERVIPVQVEPDPGFEYDMVCAAGSDGSIIIRSTSVEGAENSSLLLVDPRTGVVTHTLVDDASAFDRWSWVQIEN